MEIKYCLESLSFQDFLERFELKRGDFVDPCITDFHFYVDDKSNVFGVFEEMGCFHLFSLVRGFLNTYIGPGIYLADFYYLFYVLHVLNSVSKCFPVYYSDDLVDYCIVKFSGFQDIYIAWNGDKDFKLLNL